MLGKRTGLADRLRAGADAEGERTEERFAVADRALGSREGSGQPERAKVVRDTFSFPPQEHERLKALMNRYPALYRRATRSELVRAGLGLLETLSDEELAEVLDTVERLKPGRPS